MRERGHFILGILVLVIGIGFVGMLLMAYNPNNSTLGYYLGYNTIDFIIGFAMICFGLKWAMKPFEVEKKEDVEENAQKR